MTHKEPTDPVAKQIIEHLLHEGSKQPGAILIKGKWGVGKTYFWKKEIQPYLPHRHLYVSLFGVATLGELKTRLVSKFVVKGDGETNRLQKAIDVGATVVSNVPKLVTTGIKALAKKHLDEDAVQLLDVLDLQFDPLQLLPSDLVVCFDDLERMSLGTDQFLGFVNTFMEQKNARVLLIANEDKIEGTYRQFKEKVVWLTVSRETPLEQVFGWFVADMARRGQQKAIDSKREVILGCFSQAKHPNLRTLQKTIRYLDKIEGLLPEGLDTDRARFLVALIIEDADKGHLESNSEIYSGSAYHSETFLGKRKPEDLEGPAKISYEFCNKFFKDTHGTGFTKALYEFVLHGVLNEQALLLEIHPPDTREAAVRLLQEVQKGDWMFGNDTDVRELLDRVQAFLEGSEEAHVGVVAQLYLYLGKLCRQIDIPIPNLDEALQRRIKGRAALEERLEAPDRAVRTEEERRDVQKIVDDYKKEQKNLERAKLKRGILEALEAGREPEVIEGRVRNEELLDVLLDGDVLAAADKVLVSAPTAHFRFYQDALERAVGHDGDAAKRLITVVRDRLTASKKRGNIDRSTHKRLEWLMNKLPPLQTSSTNNATA